MGAIIMRFYRSVDQIIRLLLFVLLCWLPIIAQTRGAILDVVVKDPTGALIHRAQLELRKNGKKESTAETNQRGEARFNRLALGKYRVHIEAAGFRPVVTDELKLIDGHNRVEVTLEIEEIKVDVDVSEEARVRNTDPNGPAFSNVLTPDQIAQLPDDPEEFENAIRALAGPGAQMRVNGFRGGKLPPKSQIREIRFRMNPYAAENHDAGFGLVDITTKPGINSWHGSFNFGFRDESLNGRQAFATFRGPEQQRRVGLSLDGPLWKNKTSLFLNVDGSLFFDAKTVVATLTSGTFTDLVFRPSRRLNIDARIEHALTKTHTSRVQYQRNASVQNNLGAGDFDLASRAFSQGQIEHLFRVADSGVIGKRLLNDTRLQFRWFETDIQSVSLEQTILVPGSFNSGSAQRFGGRREFEIELSDDVDYALEKHGVRFGGRLELSRFRSDDSTNSLGTFHFADLESFDASLPTQFTQRIGNPTVSFNHYQAGWYVQDDFRVRKNLTISYGLRQEVQSHVEDHFNLAPRFGFAWSPKKDGSITIRGGTGIFYDWFGTQTYEQTLRVDGVRQRDLIITNPNFPDPFSNGTQTLLPPSRIQRDPELEMPYIIQSSIGVETRPFNLFRFTTNYQYQRGVHLLRGTNLNAPVPGGLRPDSTVGNVTNIQSSAYLSAHRLMLGVGPATFVSGFFWSANYLLMKNTNESDSPFSLPVDNFNHRAERGPAANDIRHVFSAFVSRRLFKGLAASAIISANSAPPYNITTGFDDNGDTVINDRPFGIGRNSARGAGRWEIGSRLSWGLNFGPEQQSTGGPQVRMIRVGPGEGASAPTIASGNTKKYRLEFYAQAFNLLNHTNLGAFSGVQTSPFFGRATSAQLPRRFEIGTRFNF